MKTTKTMKDGHNNYRNRRKLSQQHFYGVRVVCVFFYKYSSQNIFCQHFISVFMSVFNKKLSHS